MASGYLSCIQLLLKRFELIYSTFFKLTNIFFQTLQLFQQGLSQMEVIYCPKFFHCFISTVCEHII